MNGVPRLNLKEAMSSTTRPRAFSYLRFSTPEQMKGDSSRRQTALAREYAHRHDLELDEKLSFHDLGVSAYRGKNIETGKLGWFLRAVEEELVPRGSYLLVESLDRISRAKPRKALRTLEDIVEMGITLVTLSDGKIYTEKELNDDMGSLIYALMVASRAHDESETKSKRLKAAWEEKRRNLHEKPLTSLAPKWLRMREDRRGFEPDEDRAPVVRRIFSMADRGAGQHLIAATLNREGVPTFGAGLGWNRSYIKKILGNPAVVGTFTPHEFQFDQTGGRRKVPLAPVESYYPAVVDVELFRRVSGMRPSYAKEQRELQNIFAGLAKCPRCGSTMTRVMKGTGRKGGRPKLICSVAHRVGKCERHPVDLQALQEALVNARDQLAAGSPVVAEEDVLGRLEASIRAQEAEEAALDALEEALRSEGPSPARLKKAMLDAERRIEELRAERVTLLGEIDLVHTDYWTRKGDELAFALAAEPLDIVAVNALLRQLLTSITIDWTKTVAVAGVDQIVPNYGEMVLTWRTGATTSIDYGSPFPSISNGTL